MATPITLDSIVRDEDIPEPTHWTSTLRQGAATSHCIHVQSAILGHVTFWAERNEQGFRGRQWAVYVGIPARGGRYIAEDQPTLAACVAAVIADVQASERIGIRLHGITYGTAGLPVPVPEPDEDSLGPVVNADGTPTAVTLSMLTGVPFDSIRAENERERDIALRPARSSGGPFTLGPRLIRCWCIDCQRIGCPADADACYLGHRGR